VFCPGCGNNVGVGERFCTVCGREASANSPPAPALMPAAEGTIFPAQTSGKAIASLVCGLFLFAFPLSILAVIFGHLSVSEIRKSAGRLKGEGMAITGLVLGYVGLAIIPVILIVAAIAIPNLLRARIAANEASAAASVRTLLAGETAYSSSHPQMGFTCRFSDLSDTGLIDSTLAHGLKNGYVFDLQGCHYGNGNITFHVVAYPVSRQQSGSRAFCADESGVIKFDRTGSPRDCIANGSPLR
jgi:type IV pilus assembly protein PilA